MMEKTNESVSASDSPTIQNTDIEATTTTTTTTAANTITTQENQELNTTNETENESRHPSSATNSANSSFDVIDAPTTSSLASLSPNIVERDDHQTEDMSGQKDANANIRYGKCKWFNVAKGWGFITPNDGGQEVFVHQSVIQMPGFRSLGEQEDVEFEAKETERGLEAIRVSGCNGIDCHGSTFRPRGSNNRTNSKKKRRRIRCYNCGEFSNHIAAKCELGPQPKRCHFCKQTDHLYADCPTKTAQPS